MRLPEANKGALPRSGACIILPCGRLPDKPRLTDSIRPVQTHTSLILPPLLRLHNTSRPFLRSAPRRLLPRLASTFSRRHTTNSSTPGLPRTVQLRNLLPLNTSLPPSPTMADDVPGDMALSEYEFPEARLRRRIQSSDRTPLVLIACGSFSPITFLHLRMFEMAADYARFNTDFEVVGAYLSCVGDAYKKTGLVKAEHRINMCSLAVQQSSWIGVDPWEALHSEYLPTARVLDHFEHEINEVRGGVETPVGKKKCRIALLAGADLIQTMSTPGVWAQADIDYMLRNFGAFIVEVSANTPPTTATY